MIHAVFPQVLDRQLFKAQVIIGEFRFTLQCDIVCLLKQISEVLIQFTAQSLRTGGAAQQHERQKRSQSLSDHRGHSFHLLANPQQKRRFSLLFSSPCFLSIRFRMLLPPVVIQDSRSSEPVAAQSCQLCFMRYFFLKLPWPFAITCLFQLSERTSHPE